MTGDNISRCDWYSATVNAPTDGLISGFLHHFDAVPRETVAHNSYKRAVEVVRGESRIATVSWGGVNLRPSVVSSGAASQEVMVYLRSLSSPHSVSRMDAAIDFVGTFVFSQITEMIIKILKSTSSVALSLALVRSETGSTARHALCTSVRGIRVLFCVSTKNCRTFGRW